MKLYVTHQVIVSAVLVAHSTATTFPVSQPANFPLANAFSAANIQREGGRLLRFQPAGEDNAKEEVEEERGFNFNFAGLENILKPKTAEELAEAAKKAASKKFWGGVADNLSVRRERFPAWKRDGMEVSSVIAQLEAHGFKGGNFDEIAKKYVHFRKTGEIL